MEGAVTEHFGRRLRIVEIPLGDRRTAHQNLTFMSLRQECSLRVDDHQLMISDASSNRNMFEKRSIVKSWCDDSFLLKACGVNAQRSHALSLGRDRRRQGPFGQPVRRPHNALGMKTTGTPMHIDPMTKPTSPIS